MALAPFPLDFHARTYRTRQSSYFLLLEPQRPSPNSCFRTLKLRALCSGNAIQLDAPEATTVKIAVETLKKKTKRKAKPSFFEEIRHRWSNKCGSTREKLPWQGQEGRIEHRKQHHHDDDDDKEEEEEEQNEPQEVEGRESSSGSVIYEGKTDFRPSVVTNDAVSFPLPSRATSAPWVQGSKPYKSEFSHSKSINGGINMYTGIYTYNHDLANGETEEDSEPDDEIELSGDAQFPMGGHSKSVWRRKNTRLAEKVIPAHELIRLRKVALRMPERFKVGSAGITQALVEAIHEKWKLDEVVKLKFEEPLSLNMRRAHETLQNRTGGLVIWRSGSSIVLFRGMSYNFPCVQSFAKQIQAGKPVVKRSDDPPGEIVEDSERNSSVKTSKLPSPDSLKYPKDVSNEELIDLTELNYILDELGPRFTDWPGCQPLPVDADLLPPLIPGYKTPFRLLPYGFKPCLNNKEMTDYRRLARRMPPHFALGRNRDLQGLAKAMAKLWEKSAIAKIAVKRGVVNTCNERMAEELKRLTGGTLLSRNKDYIVFFRGNDFLPPDVVEVLSERQKMVKVQQEEEDKARQIAAAKMSSKAKISKSQLVAGTLSETIAAASRWAPEPDTVDVGEMKREVAVTKQVSLIRNLEQRLAFAKRKLRKAELALAKVQKDLEPADLPSDLEVITNEERFLYRKIGLSMKPYLLVGRRGVYDGTIENMHLHWKHRELVKLIVKGKTLAQVKHVAISLEAESGGVLVSVDRTTKGYAIIVYRGKNYQFPQELRPKHLLSRKQALARSTELQRREALKHHIIELQERIESLKQNQVWDAHRKADENLYLRMDDSDNPSNDSEQDEMGGDIRKI